MSRKEGLLICAILIFLSLGAIRFAINMDKSKSHEMSSFSPQSPEVETLVNKHLVGTAHRVLLQEERAHLENSDIDKAPEIGDEVWPEFRKNKGEFAANQGVDLSADPKEMNAYQDLNRHPKEYGTYKSAHSIIQNELALNEDRATADLTYRAQYAQRFIENARRSGYQVKLNDDFVVISVKKISDSNSFKVVEPGGQGSR